MRLLSMTILALGLIYGRAFGMTDKDVEAFHHAVATGDVATVETMLKADPKLATSVGDYGFQPMNLQDLYFEPRIFKLLLGAGADVNAVSEDGITLLHIIAEPEPVAEIVKAGGNIEARDKNGRTPLLLNLTEPDREDVIEALIEAGADVNARDKAGRTALSMAQERSNDEATNLLLQAGAHP